MHPYSRAGVGPCKLDQLRKPSDEATAEVSGPGKEDRISHPKGQKQNFLNDVESFLNVACHNIFSVFFFLKRTEDGGV